MKPLCEKIYINKIVEIVTALICAALDIIFIVNKDDDFFWWMVIIPFTALVVWMIIDSIYWIFQPKILIYQYDTGIVINRSEKIEYTDIVFNMMPKLFTLGELQKVYEVILGKALLMPAFRRIIAEKVEKTDKQQTGGGHRPSVLFKYKGK